MRIITVIALLALPTAVEAGQTGRGAQRFEVTSLRAVRPALAAVVAALQKKDVAGAKAAIEAYDSGWNGVEVYINVRSMEMYNELERNYQTKITEGVNSPSPNVAALLTDAQAMLAKYDETIAMVERAMPLNRLYDDVARLRIERAHLREVPPALKAGNLAKARKSFEAFNDNWDNIEMLVKDRSLEAYNGIEGGMIAIENALMPARPDVDNVITLVTGVMDQYNMIVAQVTREARNAK